MTEEGRKNLNFVPGEDPILLEETSTITITNIKVTVDGTGLEIDRGPEMNRHLEMTIGTEAERELGMEKVMEAGENQEYRRM